MRRKYKLTGCARFLIFLLIAIPVVYIAATMVTGTSPLEEINKLLGKDGDTREIQTSTPSNSDTTTLDAPIPGEQVTKIEEKDAEPIISNRELLDRIEQLEKRLSVLEQKME
nr:hypothetical protein [Saprospiraceae bacterium]